MVAEIAKAARREAERVRKELEESEYVSRRVFREGSNPAVELALNRRYGRRRTKSMGSGFLLDTDLAKPQNKVLLGEAGSGKSFVLQRAFVESTTDGHLQTAVALLVDLGRDLGTSGDISSAILGRYEIGFQEASAGGSTQIYLMLDSLDEVVRKRGREFVNDVRQFLLEHREHLAGWIIGCRRSVYEPGWFDFGEEDIELLHVDHLSDEEYRQILPDEEARQRFFEECHGLNISELLNRPFDGFYLAHEHRDGRPLPTNRVNCLRQMTDAALAQAGANTGVSVARLKEIATWTACLATFGKTDSWSEQELINELAESTEITERRAVVREEVTTLFGASLFTRSADGFGFSHDLFREYLTALAIKDLSLRKLRLLLVSENPASGAICTDFRGVATFLAGQSIEFCKYLLKSDPMVAFLAESNELPPNECEDLVRTVIDTAVEDQRYPWWEIPPRGERPDHQLHRFKPSDVGSLLSTYLSGDTTSKLWATACASSWGGDVNLNPQLLELALSPEEHQEIRRWAMSAIESSEDDVSIEGLFPLLEDGCEWIRMDALGLWYRNAKPEPAAFLKMLASTSKGNDHFWGEAAQFGRTLSCEHFNEVIDELRRLAGELRGLVMFVVDGMCEVAEHHGLDGKLSEFVLELLGGELIDDHVSIDHLADTLKRHASVCDEVWRLAVEFSDEEGFDVYQFNRPLAACIDERVFDLLPPVERVSERQRRFISSVVHYVFEQDTTIDSFSEFEAKAPDYVKPSWKPQPPKVHPEPDVRAEEATLFRAIDESDGGVNGASRLFDAIASMEPKTGRHVEGIERAIEAVLARHSTEVERRVVDVFEACVNEVEYGREETGDTTFTRTSHWWLVPYRVLRSRGGEIQPNKIGEVITCYGFAETSVEQFTYWSSELVHLRQRDEEVWRHCIRELINRGRCASTFALRHLVEVHDEFFADECRSRLNRGEASGNELDELLDYWELCKPADYAEALQNC